MEYSGNGTITSLEIWCYDGAIPAGALQNYKTGTLTNLTICSPTISKDYETWGLKITNDTTIT